ncbi:MAG: Holliday junction resolvase RuvX [Bacillota bacterium]
MRFLGLDVGDRTIGLALSDPLGVTAQGLGVLKRGKLSDDAAKVAALAKERGAGEIVVGLPRAMDGGLGPQARKVLEFVAVLERHGLKVRLWDERFTTSAAERYLIQTGVRREKRRRIIDQVAAVLILQSYLDYRQKSDRGGT